MKKTGIGAFGRPAAAPTPTTVEPAAKPAKDKREVVAIRMSREQWRRIRELGLDHDRTVQELGMEAFSLLLAKHGLPPL